MKIFIPFPANIEEGGDKRFASSLFLLTFYVIINLGGFPFPFIFSDSPRFSLLHRPPNLGHNPVWSSPDV